MPDQCTSVFFRELINEILDFFEPGEKEKIMLQHSETLIQPTLKKRIKIPIIPGSKVFVNVLLMLTPENPFFADEIMSACPCNAEWRNHGQYVACVAKSKIKLLRKHQERLVNAAVSIVEAAKSNCGKK